MTFSFFIVVTLSSCLYMHITLSLLSFTLPIAGCAPHRIHPHSNKIAYKKIFGRPGSAPPSYACAEPRQRCQYLLMHWLHGYSTEETAVDDCIWNISLFLFCPTFMISFIGSKLKILLFLLENAIFHLNFTCSSLFFCSHKRVFDPSATDCDTVHQKCTGSCHIHNL